MRRVHMVGIGGIGMSSIAEVLLNRGYSISGSDLRTSPVTERLVSLGATIHEGHRPDQVGDADVIVYSSAVDPAVNPETVAAADRLIPIIGRAEMLGELMRMKYGIGIAGTHGKTTTTSMAGVALEQAGLDPTVIVGGKVTAFGSNAMSGSGDVIVIEADEYDRTFLRLNPVIAVITTIEAEHLDIYADLDDIKQAFITYANSVPFFGAAILCIDDQNVQSIIKDVSRRVVTYGTARQARIRAVDIRPDGPVTRFSVLQDGEPLGEVVLPMPGLHNVRNALAALTVGLEMDIPFAELAAGLARFSGVERRFQLIADVDDIRVYDDYAHHPTEVVATLQAVQAAFPGRRVVTVFQPHLYSRTQQFVDQFAQAFVNTDVLIVTEIYGARERPIEGVSGKLISDAATQSGQTNVVFLPDNESILDWLDAEMKSGDIVLTMGAGSIWRLSRVIAERLEKRSK